MILFGTISIYKTVLCFGKKVGAGEMPKPNTSLGTLPAFLGPQCSENRNQTTSAFFFFFKQKVLELESADSLNV